MHEEACHHTLSALHTMLRHAVHRALFGAHSTIVCLTAVLLPPPPRSCSSSPWGGRGLRAEVPRWPYLPQQ